MSVKMTEKTKISDSVCLTLTAGTVKGAVKSYTFSKRYINTVAKAAVLNIVYHRIPIDDKDFITKKFQGTMYKSFRSKSQNPLIREYHANMQGFKDALEKSYLKDMYLYLINADTNEILENYKFSLSYNDNKENNSNPPPSFNSLMEGTIDFLRALEGLASYPKLGDNVVVKMELTYFDDIPQDYQPPGFEAINSQSSYRNKINKVTNSVTLGRLMTGFHDLRCRGKGYLFDTLGSSQMTPDLDLTPGEISQVEAEEPYNTIDLTDEEDRPPALATTNIDSGVMRCISDPMKMFTPPVAPITDAIEILSETFDGDEGSPSSCVCNNPNIPLDLIRCIQCKQSSHYVCQGYLDKSYIRPPFRCFKCNGGDDILADKTPPNTFQDVYKSRYILATLYKDFKLSRHIEETHGSTIKELLLQRFIELGPDGSMRAMDMALRIFFDFRYKLLAKPKTYINRKLR